MPHRHALLAALAACALSLNPLEALGQTDPGALASARSELLRQAHEAQGRFDHAIALELAERAAQLAMDGPLRIFIAETQIVLGDLGAALNSSRECVREAEREGERDSAREALRVENLRACRALSSSLEARVGRVVLTVPRSAQGLHGLEVRVAGRLVAPTAWSVPQYVAAGSVVIEAHDDGGREFHAEVQLPARGSVAVTVQPREGLLLLRPGEHRHRLELEGHFSAYNPLYCHGAGFGGGARVGIPLLRNGFISSINNNISLSLGADVFYNSDVRCRSTSLHIPAALQWNFFLSGSWSVFFEPTLFVSLPVNTGNCSTSSGSTENGCSEVLVVPGASLGARWHFNSDGSYPSIVVRGGWPVGFNLGMTF